MVVVGSASLLGPTSLSVADALLKHWKPCRLHELVNHSNGRSFNRTLAVGSASGMRTKRVQLPRDEGASICASCIETCEEVFAHRLGADRSPPN